MKKNGLFTGATLIVLCLLIVSAARSQETGDDQVAVWAVIEKQWAAENQDDSEWIDELLTADFVGWPYDSPAPRSRASTRMWNEVAQSQWENRAHELYPLSIVVRGDTAIAHYLFSNAGENADGKIVTRNGRFTDVLVRVDREWKFLSWHGGDNDNGD
ncbi:MAG: nuclear transport factor 2 family protein [Woeseia sp.]